MREPPSVKEQPEVRLTDWQIIRITKPGPVTDHFVGVVNDSHGRVSSPIVKFWAKRRIGETASGRRYILVGEPGDKSQCVNTWTGWKFGRRVAAAEWATDRYV